MTSLDVAPFGGDLILFRGGVDSASIDRGAADGEAVRCRLRPGSVVDSADLRLFFTTGTGDLVASSSFYVYISLR